MSAGLQSSGTSPSPTVSNELRHVSDEHRVPVASGYRKLRGGFEEKDFSGVVGVGVRLEGVQREWKLRKWRP